jgi:hypothetical protein
MAQMAVAVLRGDKTIVEIAEKFAVHPNQITAWKAQLLERRIETFGEKADGTPVPSIERMELEIGRSGLMTYIHTSIRTGLVLLSAECKLYESNDSCEVTSEVSLITN